MTSTPAAVGQTSRLRYESIAAVVDPLVEPELGQPFQLVVARCRGEDPGSGPLRHLDGGDPDASGTGMNQSRLARFQVPELEQAIVGRPERHRHAGRLVGGELVGNLPGE